MSECPRCQHMKSEDGTLHLIQRCQKCHEEWCNRWRWQVEFLDSMNHKCVVSFVDEETARYFAEDIDDTEANELVAIWEIAG